MCGRTACTLAPNDVQRACRHKTKDDKWTKPSWRDAPGGHTYNVSHNVCPGTHTPVLFSKHHVDLELAKSGGSTCESDPDKTSSQCVYSSETQSSWVIQPMRWGLVPSWHQGESTKGVGYNMINARSDSILSKRTFKGPLDKGRRCVILVDGYFEWQASEGKKQPYFVYFPHSAEVKKEDFSDKLVDEDGDEIPEGWEGKRLMTLAGLFDIWRPKDGSAPVYSYSIITVEAHKSVKWLHDRMPAILDGEEEVSAWLDAGNVPATKAVKDLIRPIADIQHHPVSNAVGDNKNKSEECTKPISLEKQKKSETASSNFMSSWLAKGSKRKSTDTSTDTLAKEEGVSSEKKIKESDEEK